LDCFVDDAVVVGADIEKGGNCYEKKTPTA
jgi:hypothetical protein